LLKAPLQHILPFHGAETSTVPMQFAFQITKGMAIVYPFPQKASAFRESAIQFKRCFGNKFAFLLAGSGSSARIRGWKQVVYGIATVLLTSSPPFRRELTTLAA